MSLDGEEWRKQLAEADERIAQWIERFDKSQAALAKAIEDAGHLFDEKQEADARVKELVAIMRTISGRSAPAHRTADALTRDMLWINDLALVALQRLKE